MTESSPQTTNDQRIPVPFSQWFRHFRYGILPFISFALLVLATGWMWHRQARLPGAVGEVEAVRSDVAAGADGTLAPLVDIAAAAEGELAETDFQWSLFDPVNKGDVLARLDDRPVQAQLKTLEKEVERLTGELTAAEEQFVLDQHGREHDHRREYARLYWELQRHRLNVLDRQTEIETARVELMRLEERVRSLERISRNSVSSALELSGAQLERDRVRETLVRSEAALKEAKTQGAKAKEQLEEFPDPPTLPKQKLLGPLESAIAVQEALQAELHVLVDGLQIRAPISGMIVAIHCWPGQNVRMGDPVLTLASSEARYLVSYVRTGQRVRPTVGTPVDVRMRVPGATPVASAVSHVGPQVELIPEHQRQNPTMLEWGLPVRIELPDGLPARPGELVDVRFKKKPKDSG
jgi:multidrug resistance efflux pump